MSSPLIPRLLLAFGLCAANALDPAPTLAGPSGPPSSPARLRVAIPIEAAAPFDHALEDLIKEFNATHPKIMVEPVKSGGSFQSLRGIIAAHYANDLPDLALINTADLPTLEALHIVQPLPQAWYAAKKFLPGLVSSLKCASGPCSLPFQRKLPVWFFNRELLFKMNQETEKIPTSWAKIAQLSQRLTKQGELWALAIPKTGDGAAARWTALGMPLVLTSESVVEWIARLWQQPANWLPGTPTPEEATRLFLEQRAVILLGSLDQMPFLKSNASFRFGAALPDGDLGWFGMDFVVLTKSKSVEATREFLDYVYRPEASLIVHRAAHTLPVTRAQAENTAWRKETDGQPVIKNALTRRLKPVGIERVVPQLREEFATMAWEAIELAPESSQRPLKAAELKARFQKKLSTNPH